MDYSPVKIKTIFDLFWWCNFCFKWQDVDSMIFTFSDTSDWRSTISSLTQKIFKSGQSLIMISNMVALGKHTNSKLKTT